MLLSNIECGEQSTPSLPPPVPLPSVAEHVEPQTPPETPDDQSSLPLSEIGLYRRGFNDAADGLPEQSKSWAYADGYSSGLSFRERISATRQPLEGHFPGWTIAHPERLPACLRYASHRGMVVELRLPKFKHGHGGARRGAKWRELAVLDKPPAVAEVDHALDRSRIERADPGDQ